jgi:glycosyltransferase involved in cell wall biosynthesis
MKLVAFTPGSKVSAIGRMTHLLVQELLSGGHTVIVVCTDSARCRDDQARDFGVETMHWTDAADVRAALTSADAVVYHIGDNFQFHEGGLYWLERQRGIVCLHDFFLGHLFLGWAESNRKRALAILHHWYGEDVARDYFNRAASSEFIALTHRDAPMTEWVVGLASAVVIHSEWGAERVLRACPGPVHVVPLAYDAPPDAGLLSESSVPSGGIMRVLTVGHVNPNKRADVVIRAIGADKRLREGTSYTLAGAIRPEMRCGLEKLAAELSVDLYIRGEVSEQELRQLWSSADVVCCLRKPTLEGASASTIEAMLYGRAVIVENTGFYGELPEDCVRKIRPEHEESDLLKELLDFKVDPVLGKAIGIRAQNWARKTFTAKNYAQQIINLVPLSQKSMLVTEMIQTFVRQLFHWNEAEPLLTLSETIKPIQIFDGINQNP